MPEFLQRSGHQKNCPNAVKNLFRCVPLNFRHCVNCFFLTQPPDRPHRGKSNHRREDGLASEHNRGGHAVQFAGILKGSTFRNLSTRKVLVEVERYSTISVRPTTRADRARPSFAAKSRCHPLQTVRKSRASGSGKHSVPPAVCSLVRL